MAKTKPIIEEKPEDETATEKPRKALPKPPQNVTIDNKALRDLILLLRSTDFEHLKQLTNLPLKLIDPIAKGMAYYDSTMKTIEGECSELLDWYVDKCEKDILECKWQLKVLESTEKAKTGENAENTRATIENKAPENKKPMKRSLWDRFWNPNPKIDPELEKDELDKRLEELEARLVTLKAEQTTIETETSVQGMYFPSWAYNYFLNRRSQGGDDNFLKMMVMLTDGQIVNQQESGGLDPSRIFNR